MLKSLHHGIPLEIFLDSAINSYARPRMQGQNTYIEVWVEKDALSGVLSRVTEKYHIPICVNRGYSSASAMHEAFKRFYDAFTSGQKCRVIYLGDYDPSGIDMIRDVEHRILEFFFGKYFVQGKRNKKIPAENFKDILAERKGLDFEILPIALTRDQITQYNPPKNPAKITDPRAAKFIADKGVSSWEVDALRPDVLNQILTKAIKKNIDIEQYQTMVDAEEFDKDKLREIRKKHF